MSRTTEYNCEGYFVKSFKVGRRTFILDLLKREDKLLIQMSWKDQPLIWAKLSGGSLYKGQGKRNFSLYLLILAHVGKLFPNIRASLGF